MHTASVLALGFVVLAPTQVFAPERVYPWLGLVSGLIALGLGASLLVSGSAAWSDRSHAHGHAHPHGEPPRRGTPRSTCTRTTPGVLARGGWSPSPSPAASCRADGARRPPRAVARDRVAYGLALIWAFSLGLATALVVVGIVALKARDTIVEPASRAAVGRLIAGRVGPAIAMVGLAADRRGVLQV